MNIKVAKKILEKKIKIRKYSNSIKIETIVGGKIECYRAIISLKDLKALAKLKLNLQESDGH